jgi:hypothetical protein
MKEGEHTEKDKAKPGRNSADNSNILQPSGVRHSFCFSDEVDRFLSNHRPYFLLHIGILFWIVLYCTTKTFKR